MRVYDLVLDDRATLKPSSKSAKLIEEALPILPGMLPEGTEFEAEFRAWSNEAKAAAFPPTVTTLEGLPDCYVMKSFVGDVIAERMRADIQRVVVRTPQDDANYELVHPCGTLVPLDEPNASVKRFPSDGRVRSVVRYAFRPADVEGRYLFRATMRPHIQLCTDEFRIDALGRGWEPLIFVPVWDSEHAPFAHTPDRDEIASRPEIYGPEGFKSVPERLIPKEWLSS